MSPTRTLEPNPFPPSVDITNMRTTRTLGAAAMATLAHAQANCTSPFTDITASAWMAAANPGWNLGNTLDAIPDEGSWNNPAVVASTFDAVVEAGFKHVRIPVTYTHHFLSEAPDYEIDPAWLQRVSDVVDMALERDLLVITNVHHDSWEWADISLAGADVAAIQDKFVATWTQVAEKLACKPETVAFETINEPPANTAADGANINLFNDLFLDVLAASGGYNARRVVTLTGGGMDATKTSQWFEVPFGGDFTNPWALQFHYYGPYDFIFGAWGKTIWGNAEQKAQIASEMDLVASNFSDVPLYIGEFDASPTNTETAARWKWFDHFMRTATEIGAAVAIWDNGLDHLDRDAGTWRDPTTLEIMFTAIEGVVNSLPDSTVDATAATQFSSAYIFHRVGNALDADKELPWLFNGNTLDSVTLEGEELVQGTDFTVSASAVTFSAAYLSALLPAEMSPGSVANFTLAFSAGTSIPVEFILWDVPVLESTSSTAVAGSDLLIPVTWGGIETVAAVKMLTADGTYLVDDWTQYLGPLEQARGVSLPSLCICRDAD